MSVTNRWTVADITNIVFHMPHVSLVCLGCPMRVRSLLVPLYPHIGVHITSSLSLCLGRLQGWRDGSVGRMLVGQA